MIWPNSGGVARPSWVCGTSGWMAHPYGQSPKSIGIGSQQRCPRPDSVERMVALDALIRLTARSEQRDAELNELRESGLV